MKTKAVRIHGKMDLRLEEIELPQVGPDDVQVKVISDSICMSTYKAAVEGEEHKRVPNDVAEHPTIVGHEFCGVIDAVGKNWQHKYKVGQGFAIQPAQPYTSEDLDYNDPDSRVSKEHADPSLEDVALAQDTPDDWASYDTVLIGYPIWWGEAAYPVASFAKANDFTGKTVIPFCTSASSGLGQSAEHLSELANGGEWMGGMRFPSGVNGDEVRQWVDDLGLEKQNL